MTIRIGFPPRRVVTVVWVAAAITGASATAASATHSHTRQSPDGRAWRVTSSPFTISFLNGRGDEVTGEVGGSPAGPGERLSYQVGGPDLGTTASFHQLTDLLSTSQTGATTRYMVATDEPGRTATISVSRTPQGVRVHWSLTPATDVTAMFESLSAGAQEQYMSGSSASSVDVRGLIRGWSPSKEGDEAGGYCQNQEQTASPFYLSSGGYGFYAQTEHVGRFAFPGAAPTQDGPTCAMTSPVPRGSSTPQPCPVSPTAFTDRVQICVKSSDLVYNVYTGTPAQVTTDYYRTVGLPSLPPPSEFGLIKWRDVNASQAQVLDDVQQFEQRNIPITTIFIDNPWEQQPPGVTARSNSTACNGSFKFDSTAFPDPQAMIDQIHSEGLKFGLWVSPIMRTPSGASCAGLNDVWSNNGWLIPGTDYIDFTNPAAREFYIQQLTALFKMGVDMAKEDRGDEFRLETTKFANGTGATNYLRYPDLYQSAVTQALRAADGNDFETLVRAGVPGTAEHTHGMWGSDAFENFDALQTEVRYGMTESLTGHFAWGSDTGGIDPQPPANATNSPTPTLFTRWSQFSSVSPVMEVGGAGLNATPWLYPDATVARFRDSAVLHYELFPYLYGLARNAARTGVPILRSVGYQYPGDQQAWAADQEFMVGPDLLAAPVTSDRAEADGEAGQATPVDVYLPAGEWVDLFTGQTFEGGQHVVIDSDLDSFPLFMRAGSAIGYNARQPDVWGASGWGTNDLSKAGLSGWMYAPGGSGSTTALSSDRGQLRAVTSGHQVRLTLTGSTPRAQLLVLADQAPSSVRVDGRSLSFAADAATLQGMSQGWTFVTGEHGGVMLKLTPSRGGEDVALTFASGPLAAPVNPLTAAEAGSDGGALRASTTVDAALGG